MAFPNLIRKMLDVLRRTAAVEEGLSSVRTDLSTAVTTLTTNINGKAAKSHAVNATTFGIGTGTLFGHVKLYDDTDKASYDATKGFAATPKAVNAVATTANSAITRVGAVETAISKLIPSTGGTVTGALNISGSVTVPTVAAGSNNNNAASTAWVRREMLNIVYPVGSIYMSVVNKSPATFLGGTWAALGGRFLIAANSTYAAGSTGGAATHKIVVDELPKHTHTITVSTAGKHAHERGTMNITGSFQLKDDSGTIGCFVNAKKAFNTTNNNRNWRLRCTEERVAADVLNFNAADGWTGKTSEVAAHGHTATASSTGAGTAMSLMPPYLSVYMWKRTA